MTWPTSSTLVRGQVRRRSPPIFSRAMDDERAQLGCADVTRSCILLLLAEADPDGPGVGEDAARAPVDDEQLEALDLETAGPSK